MRPSWHIVLSKSPWETRAATLGVVHSALFLDKWTATGVCHHSLSWLVSLSGSLCTQEAESERTVWHSQPPGNARKTWAASCWKHAKLLFVIVSLSYKKRGGGGRIRNPLTLWRLKFLIKSQHACVSSPARYCTEVVTVREDSGDSVTLSHFLLLHHDWALQSTPLFYFVAIIAMWLFVSEAPALNFLTFLIYFIAQWFGF